MHDLLSSHTLAPVLLTASLLSSAHIDGLSPKSAAVTPLPSSVSRSLCYYLGNVLLNIQVPDKSIIRDPILDHYKPRTELGRRLLALRGAYLEAGGKLMSWDEINEEVRKRRGGMSDE